MNLIPENQFKSNSKIEEKESEIKTNALGVTTRHPQPQENKKTPTIQEQRKSREKSVWVQIKEFLRLSRFWKILVQFQGKVRKDRIVAWAVFGFSY